MEENQKKVLAKYFENRTTLKDAINSLLTRLEDDEEEKNTFVNFFKENKDKNELVVSGATEIIKSILKELQFPYNMRSFDDLFMEVLELDKDYYDLGFDSYHGLFDYNSFYDICGANGNIYAINFNLDNPEIVYIDHSAQYCSEDHLPDLYMDMGFWFDEQTQLYINEKGLLIDEIFDTDGTYKIHSKYILEHVNSVSGEGYSYHTFVNFIISKTYSLYTELFK